MSETDVREVGNPVGKQESRKKVKYDSRKQEIGKEEHRKVGKQESRESSESREIREEGKYGSREVGKQVIGSRKYEE